MSDRTEPDENREDLRRLLTEQRNEYQHLSDQIERMLRLILSVLALVGSSVSAQYVFSIEIPKTLVKIDRATFNQTLADGVRVTSDVTLQGFGRINFTIAVGVLGLAMLVLVEMMVVAVFALTLPRLRPFGGDDGHGDLERADYREWIGDNHGRITVAAERLQAVYRKLLCTVVLAVFAGVILTGVYFDVVWLLLLVDAVVFALSLGGVLALAFSLCRAIESLCFDAVIDYRQWLLTRWVGPLSVVGFLPLDYYAMHGSGKLVRAASAFDLWGQFLF